MQFPFTRLAARITWLKCHVYLALVFGLLFALLGLTGSLSVYREELDTLFNPQLTVQEGQGAYLPLDRIFKTVQAAHPRQHGSWTLELPRSPDGTITAWLEKPHETFNEYYAPLMVAVNPYTAEVTASRFWGHTAMTWLLDLHTQLRLDAFGWKAVGILGLLLAVSVVSGVYLWWPGWRRLRAAFTLRHDAGLMRLLSDLHRWLGLCSAPLLLLLAFTGFNLAFPAVLESFGGSGSMGHGDGDTGIRSTAMPNQRPVSLAEAVLVARGPFPKSELRRVGTPDGVKGTYRINLRQRDETNQRHPFTTVWVDRWSGQILEVRNPSRFTSAQAFAAWMWPLHTGEALGGAGRLLWFIAGLTPAALYIAGLLHWLHRRGMIGDRQVDLPAYRRAFAAGFERFVWRSGVKLFHILKPRAVDMFNRLRALVARE